MQKRMSLLGNGFFLSVLAFSLTVGCAASESANDAGTDARPDTGGGRDTGPDVPGLCADDAFEDNDFAAGATSLSPGSSPGLRMCAGDEDFFAINLNTGDQLTATVTFRQAEGDINITLLAPGDSVVASSTSVTDDEQITHTAETSGRFILQVTLISDQGSLPGTDYDLNLALVPGGLDCNDDLFEDNDTPDGAEPVGQGSFSDLRLCPGDSDFYAVVLSTGDEVTITASFSHAEGDIDMLLLDPEGGVVGTADSTTDDEQIVHTAVAAGTFVLQTGLVADLGTQDGNNYTLNVSIVPGTTSCADDAFEPNDSPDAAGEIDEGTFNNLRVCTGDDDFYSIVLSAGDVLAVDIAFSQAEGDLDLGLIDPAGELVAAGDSMDDDESFSFTAATAGTYLIWVNFFEDMGSTEGNSYDLTVTINPTTGTCADDSFEDNDSVDAATSIAAGSFPDLRVCTDDGDAYAVALSAGDEIMVDVTFAHAEGDIDVGLVNPAGDLVAASESTDDNEQVVFTATQAGTYLVLVVLIEDTGSIEGNDYEMVIAVEPFSSTCNDDLLENNDSPDNASPLEAGEHAGLRACQLDDDFYAITLSQGDEITIDLTFSQAEGDLDLGLIDPAGTIVASSSSEDDNEQIVYTAATAGTHVIWVNFFEDLGEAEGNDYSLNVTIGPVVTTCEDDLFEPNDSADAAAAVEPGSLTGLRGCADDDDFYAVALSAGDEIAIVLTFAHADADLDLGLINPEGSLVAVSGSEDDNEQVVYTAAVSGTFVIWVNFFEDFGDEGTDYDLDITVTPVTSECDDDLFEDNDSPETAASVEEGTFEALRMCGVDDDFYAIVLAAGDTITVDAAFSHADGDIDLGLINPDDALVATSGSEDDNEQLTYMAAVPGRFVIWVNFFEDFGDEGTDYALTIAVEPAVSECADDLFEDNDSVDAASAVDEGTVDGLRMCDGDDDIYSIDLSAGDEITIDVAFSHAEGDIDVALVRLSDETVVAFSETVDDDEQVVYTVLEAGTFAIAVFLFEDLGDVPGNDYSLSIAVEPAASSCDEDAFEDNDTAETAAPIEAGSVGGLRMCDLDDDFYSIVLSAGDEITIDLTFSHAEGDIDVGLINPAGTLVAASVSVTDDEQIVYTALQAGAFVIRVLLDSDLGSAEGNDYSMDIDVVPAATTCDDDALEPNDSLESARPVVAGTIADLRLCDADDDYYSIALSSGDEITVDLAFLHAEGDIDLGLYNPAGTLVATSSSVTDDEQVVYTAQMGGTFVIWVRFWADFGDEGTSYDFTIAVEPAATSCDDDLFEPNDSIDAAVPIDVGTTRGLRMCDGDDDFYSLVLSVGDELTLDVMFAHAEGDIDVLLNNPEGTPVAFSGSTDDDEQIVYTALAAGTFTIEVRLFEDLGDVEGNDYVLDVAVEPAASGCAEDGFEDNDSAETAAGVGAGSFTNLRACTDDADFYAVVLGAGDTITVDVLFSHAEGDIDAALTNPAGTTVAFGFSVTDDEQIVYTALQGGTFIVEVSLLEDLGSVDGNDYDLTVAIDPAATSCVEDDFEDNDASDTAAPLNPGVTNGLRACDSDDDWYAITASVGDEITVDVLFTHAEGDIDVLLERAADGAPVAMGGSTTDDEQIVYTVGQAGTFLINVYLFEDLGSVEGNDYALDIGVEPVPSGCDEDGFEQNDSSDNPAAVEEGLTESLRSCDLDDDYYSIALSTGDEITVDVLFSHAEGDIDVALLNPSGTPVAVSETADDDEQIVYTAQQAGTFVIWVFLFDDLGSTAGNDYDLDITIDPVATTCADDELEPNDALDNAAELDLGTTENLRSCDLDDDFYSVFLFQDEIVTVDVLFSHAEGDIDVQFGDPEGFLVAFSESSDDNEQIVYTALEDGFHFIYVYLFEDLGESEGTDYSIAIGVE